MLTGHGGLSRPLLCESHRFLAVQVRILKVFDSETSAARASLMEKGVGCHILLKNSLFLFVSVMSKELTDDSQLKSV